MCKKVVDGLLPLILNYKGFICELSVVPHNTEGKNSDCLLKSGSYRLNWAQSTTNQKNLKN